MLISRTTTIRALGLYLLTQVLLSSCGAAGEDEKKINDVTVQMAGDSAFAENYQIEDLDCVQSGTGAASVGQSPIYSWASGSTQEKTVNFNGASSIPSLAGEGVEGTSYNLYQSTVCDVGSTSLECDGKTEMKTPLLALKVCDKDRVYTRNSVESISLTSLAALESAYEFYNSLEREHRQVAAIDRAQMIILPKVEYIHYGRRYVKTDNLAFVPSFRKKPTFVVYPKSSASVKAGLWQDVSLWEVPWVLTHEYGHHVFTTHSGIVGITSALRKEGVFITKAGLDNRELNDLFLDANPPVHSYVPEQEKLEKSKGLSLAEVRQVTATDHWDSINEGFADLFAHYRGGSQVSELANLDCFASDRDVEQSKFATGESKALSAEVLSEYLSSSFASGTTCLVASFQDIHTIGAVVAHGVDALFSTVTGSTGAKASAAKGALLLQWAESLGKLAAAREASQSVSSIKLEDLVEPVLLLVAPKKIFSAAQCDVIKTVFPVYAAKWFEAASYKCVE